MANTDLPIFELQQQLLTTVAKQRRFILTAPTGSGKSTQVPQILRDRGVLGDGQVVILQPRRLATRMLAARVAQERNVKLGDEVGYQIRFDNVTSNKTRIRFVTEGVLLRQILADPKLNGVRAILFDEFHERHLYGDITLARALQIQETIRPDLILGVMSATLDVGSLEKFLQPCAVLSSDGRTFPVEIEYLEHSGGDIPIWEDAVRELRRLVKDWDGDVLIFMPGAFEISRTVQAVRDEFGSEFIVLPLHGDLQPKDQDAAVARYDRRKVVVATNVAETSLTIDGVRIVIDSGLARIPRYDPYRGINTLLIEKISRASADQRAGRAGRTAPGRCLRLWTEREHEQRAAQELPEIKRLDLAEVVLTLKASGVDDVYSFRWLEPPDRRSLERAETLLVDLGALQSPSPQSSPAAGRGSKPGQVTAASSLSPRGRGQGEGESAGNDKPGHSHPIITPLGRRMLAFPLHPRYARMLIAAQEYGCVRQVALIAALTQGRDLLVRRQGKQVDEARDDLFGGETESDFFVLMRAWRYADRNGYNVQRCRELGIHAQSARQVGPLFEQFLSIAGREGLDVSEKPSPTEALQKCLLVGFSDHLARRMDAGTLRCELVHGRRGVLVRDSAAQKAPLFVVAEMREIEGRDKELNVLLSLATAIKEEWLRELFPNDFNETREVFYDPTLRRVMVYQRKRFRDLVIDTGKSDKPPLDEAARILAQEVIDGECVLKEWDDSVEQWILRVNRLREWMPELNIPAIGDDDRLALIQQVCQGAVSYKEIKEKPVWPAVKSWLSKEQQEWLDQFAPERLELPNGRRAKVVYSADVPPTVSARIQDLYGVNESLWIANRKVQLRIQILAPNHRPVQITDNLSLFWKEQYPKLKQELQRKYPKHEWK
ncbi:MAG: ATP-dependent RNA helicase [Verrucomicrobiae bacterium]|nr:ATP-dependent RNA helicase [Verrucomicrobiae bacterium]